MNRMHPECAVLACLAVLFAGAVPLRAQLAKAAPTTVTKTLPSQHGITTVTIPDPLMQVTVDPASGTVTLPAQTSPLLMGHQEGGDFCHKVQTVGASLAPPYRMWDEYRPAGADGALCSFAPGTIRFTGGAGLQWLNEHKTGFASACSDRIGASEDAYKYVPAVVKPWVGYNPTGADKDTLEAQNTRVEVRCVGHVCPAVSFGAYGNTSFTQMPNAQPGSSYSQQVFTPGGASIASAQVTGAPAGMSLTKDGRLTGVAGVAGSYKVTFTVVDGCAWKAQTYSGTATLAIKDNIAPTVASLTVTPDTVPWNGGTVTVVAQAKDNNAVFKVLLTVTKPDGSVSNSYLPMTSGTPKDGQWKVSFETSLNGGTTAQTYSIKVTAMDAENNKAESPSRTVVVAVKSNAPLPMLRR